MESIEVRTHDGSRDGLMPLFRLADESEFHIRSYCEIGHVLVARTEGSVAGMVQIAKERGEAEIVSLAVSPEHQGRGIGTVLIQEAQNYCRENSISRLIVCTGSWEADNIAFYQRRGFRIFNVVRDFFTPEKGYERDIREQVQLEKHL
jgi:N-acetylglutamate synthase-like GNAT family acetyltransferase